MTRHIATRVVASALSLLMGSAAFAAEGPPRGVYGCYDTRMAVNAPGCVRMNGICTGILVTPMPVVMFGLVDGATYSDYDGHRGHYTYDAGGGVITMSDGSRQGWRYRKIAEWSFRLIDNSSGKELYTCPLEPTKDPSHGPW